MDGLGLHTTAILAGSDPEQWKDWDVMPPISPTAIYKQIGPGELKRFDYSRLGNPTREVLETALAQLDNGTHGLVFTSGSAAIVAAVNLLSAGDHLVAGDDLYPGTMVYLNEVANRMNITTTYVDTTETENVISAMKPITKMIWLESASNPKLKVPDIKDIVERARAFNPEVLIVVDNTFLTPCILRPLNLGADICLMSCSKYINGHHDVIMGSIVVKNEELFERILFLQKVLGGVPTAQECYQVMRSLKTLPLRMEKHHTNGLAVAKFLESHPKVVRVNHPLLPSHAQHHRAVSQHNDRHSGMVSFMLSGNPANARIFMTSLKVVLLATSLGGFMTSVAAPGSMTRDDLDEELVAARELVPNFIRISVGLEDIDDVIKDLKQALDKAYA